MKCCCCQMQALCEFYQVRIRGLFKFLQEQFNMSFLFCIVFLIMVLLVMSTFMKLNQFHYDGFFLFYNLTPVGNDLFKVKNRNSRTRCEICSNLTLNIFHPLFQCFSCKLLAHKCRLGLLCSKIVSYGNKIYNCFNMFILLDLSAIGFVRNEKPSLHLLVQTQQQKHWKNG